MSARIWAFLSRLDARLFLLLVLVLIAALMTGPWLDRKPAGPPPSRGVAERTRPEPEPPVARPPTPPLHPDIIPFTSPFLERAVAEGLMAVAGPEPEPDPPEPGWEPAPDPAPPEPEPEPVPPEREPEPWILLYRGVFVRPDGRILGLVEWPDTGRSRFYAEGEPLGPITIERIEPHAITLLRDGARYVLERGTPVTVPGDAP